MELKIGKTFINGNGVKAVIVSFGEEGRVLHKIVHKCGTETFYDTLVSDFNDMISFNGFIEA